MGRPIDHDEFVSAMKAAGYRVMSWRGSAAYFNCLDTPAKRAYYRRRFIACDDRIAHPLAVA